jgi:hypothetical protein
MEKMPVSDIQDLERRVQTLEDIAAIKDLKARYLRACDTKQPDEVRDCLVVDGALVAYEGFPEFTDRDSFVETFRTMGCVPGVYDIHHGANPVITLEGDDRARGQWSLFFQNINLAQRSVLQMGVEYDDEYVRRDGRWWIASTRTRRTSFLMEAVGEDGTPKVVVLGESDAAFGS